ncbi:MAG: hypothetical protein JW863_21245 [Chitinispirillaceae bacterium]|nr:hypothetical protein [Chitinispirillaceae bacterium]
MPAKFTGTRTTVIAGVRSGMYRSGIQNIRWKQIDFDRVTILAMVTHGENLFASTTSSIHLSTDLGTSWTKVSTGFSSSFMNAMAIHNGFLFAGTHEKGVWRRPFSEMAGIAAPGSKRRSRYAARCIVKAFGTSASFISMNLFQPYPGRVTAVLYDVSGKMVSQLFDEHVSEGTCRYHLNTCGLSQGCYLIRVRMTDASFSNVIDLVH